MLSKALLVAGIKLYQQPHRLKSSTALSSQYFGNFGSGLCILGGTVFMSIVSSEMLLNEYVISN